MLSRGPMSVYRVASTQPQRVWQLGGVRIGLVGVDSGAPLGEREKAGRSGARVPVLWRSRV